MFEQERIPIIEKHTPPSEKKGVVVSVPFKGRGLYWDISFNGGPSRGRKPYQVTLWSWMAAMIDACVLLSLSSLFLLVFAKIVQMPAFSVLRTVRSTSDFLFLLVGIYFVTSWFYLVLLRSFFGGTVGEYTCDLRLGPPMAHLRGGYLWRVILRSTLTVCCGLILLPLISLFVGFDLAGRASGLRLYSLR
jgi:hypothetical protein